LRRKLHGVVVECVQSDIAHQSDMDAVVNAANAELRPGGGVAGAIHRAAGPGLEAECRPLAPISPGRAVITGAHHLPNRFVIHCLGPVYGWDHPAEGLLASCYRNALHLAERHGITSIAFPAISTGAFGYPSEPAARIALSTVLDEAPSRQSVRHIRFVLFDDSDYQIHARVLQGLAEKIIAQT
jgi:O-acetyl-ADP-ribose deacetylase (regulator of RNase III)